MSDEKINGLSQADYEILKQAYDFCVDTDGYLNGLVNGDTGWEQTGIKVEVTNDQMALNYYKTGVMQTSKGRWPLPRYVPKRVEIFRKVSGDSLSIGPGEYDVECNRYGAVSVTCENGKKLGLKLREFEVIEWVDNPFKESE